MRRQRGSVLREIALAPVKTAARLAVLAAALGAVLWIERPLAAYLCPECFGLTRVAPGLYADEPAIAGRALAARAEAERRVARAFGPVDMGTAWLICRDEACEVRMTGQPPARGLAAATYAWIFVRVTPRGLTATVLAHELVHVVINRRIGAVALALGRPPVWWNEGLATIVAEGRPSGCGRAVADLPESRTEWRRRAGEGRHDLYRVAACQTARWLDRNGGFPGAIAMADDLRRGAPFRP